MAKTIATIGGIALAPGVSKNRRLYTKPAIAAAVGRAQERIQSGRPMSMLTFHGADDNSREIAATLTSVRLDEDGNARFTASFTDTDAGRDIASLVDTSDGKPAHLDGVSIRGAWMGTIRKIAGPDGAPVETADDLELDGLDFTRSPGVGNARVDTFAWAGKPGQTETTERVLITESVQEARVTPITEETTGTVTGPPEAVREALAAFLPEPTHLLVNGECMPCSSARGEVDEAAFPMGKRTSGTQGPGGPFADPGYQADKKPRYQLDSKLHAKAAWSYVNQAANAAKYSGPQLKRVKGRIMKALKSFGVTVTAEGWTIDPAWQVTETVREYMGDSMAAGQTAGSWCVRASNGPVSIDLSSYCMDPADLDVILRAAAGAACDALAALDPDMDGDVDVAGAGAKSDPDHDARGESAPDDGPVTETADTTPAEAGQQEEGEAPMTETATVTPAAEAAPVTPAQDVIAEAVKAALEQDRADRQARKAAKRAAAAQAAPVVPLAAETASPAAAVTETADERIARLVEERSAARIAAEVPQVPAPVTETEDARIARMVEERVIAAKQELMATGGGPGRKGLVEEHTARVGGEAPLNSHGLPAGWPDKELHQYSPDELAQYAGPVLDQHIMKGRAVTDVLA